MRGGGRRDLSPEREKEPSSQPGAPLDLSLSAHFCLRQKKRGRPAELGGDMMLTWDGFLDQYLRENASARPNEDGLQGHVKFCCFTYVQGNSLVFYM